jgi:hypothetical protein
MPGIAPTFENIIQLTSILSPFLLMFFMLMLTFLNQNIKGIIYICGVMFVSFINVILMNSIKSCIDPNSDKSMCNIIDIPIITRFNSPNMSSVFIAFTFIYLFLPMQFNNFYNIPILISLFTLFALDSFTKITYLCTNIGGVSLGVLVGLIGGSLWYSMFHFMDLDNLLYFNELSSNKVMCKRPTKQTFKCSVYKNGKLVSTNIA